jgi:hypothetical protein
LSRSTVEPSAVADHQPAGWQASFAWLRLAPDARALVVPIPDTGHTQAMRWQADTGEPGSMIGGYFVGPAPVTREPIFNPSPTKLTAKSIDWLWGENVPVALPSRRSTALWPTGGPPR